MGLSGSRETSASVLDSRLWGTASWVHLLTLPVGRVRISCVHLTITLLVHLVDSTGVLSRNLTAGRSVADGRQVRTSTRWVVLSWWSLGRIV